MLSVKDLIAHYGSLKVLGGVSMTVSPGETAAVIGPSGCGKSTLLLLLAGLKNPTAGSVLVNGEVPIPGNRGTGLLFQQYGPFPWMTAAENAGIGLKLHGRHRPERVPLVREALETVGLGGLDNRYPRELSGGQQQRLALARVLALSPGLLLLDEPFSSLDALTRERLQDLLLSLPHGQDRMAVLVTHSVEEAVYLGTRVFLMSPMPGKIIASFANEERGRPGFRTSEAFFTQCRRVRQAMEELLYER